MSKHNCVACGNPLEEDCKECPICHTVNFGQEPVGIPCAEDAPQWKPGMLGSAVGKTISASDDGVTSENLKTIFEKGKSLQCKPPKDVIENTEQGKFILMKVSIVLSYIAMMPILVCGIVTKSIPIILPAMLGIVLIYGIQKKRKLCMEYATLLFAFIIVCIWNTSCWAKVFSIVLVLPAFVWRLPRNKDWYCVKVKKSAK